MQIPKLPYEVRRDVIASKQTLFAFNLYVDFSKTAKGREGEKERERERERVCAQYRGRKLVNWRV